MSDSRSVAIMMGQGPKAAATAGAAPLFEAVIRGDLESAAKMLIEHPDFANANDGEGDTIVTLAAKLDVAVFITQLAAAGANLDTPDYETFSALHEAARNGRVACVRALLQGGANPNAQTIAKWTPLQMAMMVRAKGSSALDYAECIAALLDAGADPLLRNLGGSTAVDLANRSALSAAIQEKLNAAITRSGSGATT